MRHFPRLASTATVALICATPALAEISAEDVWANNIALIAAMGGQMTAPTTRDDNHLMIGETTTSFTLPFDAGSLRLVTSGMTLSENADGTVAVEYPPTIEGALAIDGPDDLLASAKFSVETEGYSILAMGAPGDIGYSYVLDKATFRASDLVVPETPDMSLVMSSVISGASGSYHVTEGDLMQIRTEGTTGDVLFEIELIDDLGLVSTSTQTISGGTNVATMTIPTGKVSILNLSQALRDGLALTFNTQGARVESSEKTTLDETLTMAQKYGYVINAIDYKLDHSGLVASGRNSDIWMEFEVPGYLPLPIKARADAMTGSLALPLNKTDGLADASLGMSVEALSVDESLWSMLDPDAQLPRDPANLTLDISGQIALLMDLLDINALMAMTPDDDIPAQLHELTLTTFDLDMIGAALSATGAFTFDNTDFDTFPGFPAPDGAVDIHVSGADTLMDTLVAMGLLNKEDVTGARMMLGLFAVPGTDEDTLSSTIEIKPDGQILANGQRLQ